MPTQKILFLKGLPASGKSTFAKKLVENEDRWKRVNKDDLRAMLDDGKWSKINEGFVKHAEELLISQAIADGCNVVVDDTNLAGNHPARIESYINNLYPDHDIVYEEKFFDTPYRVCVERDLARPNPVGKKVIRRMYDANIDLYIQKYTPADGPKCIIVDIDGTLAHMNDRGPFDYTKVSTDTADPVVTDIVRRHRFADIDNSLYVIVVSGREDSCKSDTEKWLMDSRIPYDELHMRKANDKRDDTIVKKEIFDVWIRDRYNVQFVLDDRDKVVDMWRSLGLKVLQCGEGDF